MKTQKRIARSHAFLTSALALAAAVVALAAPPALAADDPAVLKDMTSVVALLGLPCGQVMRADRQADNDHVVTCNDGHRYHVFMNAEGRVVAEKK